MLPFLFALIACGPPNDERALHVLQEGLTTVPPEDECIIDPPVMCCDDLFVMKLSSAAELFTANENDLGGLDLEDDINFLEQTGVIAFTGSCPGTNARVTAIDLRIDDEGVATVTYELVTDAGDDSGADPVRPYSVAVILRPPAEITEVLYEIALPQE